MNAEIKNIRQGEDDYLLKVEDVTMKFPGVLALDKVSLYVKAGTVHALMGENGARKSTLMKILFGINKPNEGEIIFKGRKLEINGIHDALTNGISMIQQELSPIKEMTVAENIFLGREKMKGILDTEKLLKELNIEGIRPDQKMKELSTARMQLVEIAKAVSYNADLLIMDEPTSAITERQVEHLFEIIKDLKKRGIAIIYITHKMDEVFCIADEVTVLRDGKFIDTKPISKITKNALIELMVGREIGNIYVKTESKPGDVMISVRNFSKKGQFNNINFDVRSGEIFGLAGLVGAGRSEAMMSVFGANRPDTGEVFIKGKKIRVRSPKDAIKSGMAMLTEDRKAAGLFPMLDVKDNIVIANLEAFVKLFLIQHKEIEKCCKCEIDKLSIKTPSIFQEVQFLSGGNQQKVLVSRWLQTSPDVLIMDEPTRGIDVGAKAEIHRLMSDFAASGKAVIMISSELPEIIGMSDRVLVMHEGEQMAILNRDELSQERILAYAAGEKV